MAATGSGVILASCSSPTTIMNNHSHTLKLSANATRKGYSKSQGQQLVQRPRASLSSRQSGVSAAEPPAENSRSSSRQLPPQFSSTAKRPQEEAAAAGGGGRVVSTTSTSLIDYFQVSNELVIRSKADGGPPRWFSPLNCACSSASSSLNFKKDTTPLLLFLPGQWSMVSGHSSLV